MVFTSKSFLKLSTFVLAGATLVLAPQRHNTETTEPAWWTPSLQIQQAYGEESVTQLAAPKKGKGSSQAKNGKGKAKKPRCKFLIKATQKSSGTTSLLFSDETGTRQKFKAATSLFGGYTIVAGQSCPSKKKGYLNIAIYGLRASGLTAMSTDAGGASYVKFTASPLSSAPNIPNVQAQPVTDTEKRNLNADLTRQLVRPPAPSTGSTSNPPPILLVPPPSSNNGDEAQSGLDQLPGGSSPEGLHDGRCDTDEYCKTIDPSLICCHRRNGDIMLGGQCLATSACKNEGDGGGGGLPPGPPAGGDGPDNSGPEDKCRTDDECANANNPADCRLGKRTCKHDSTNGNSCVCTPWARYQCRDKGDCDAWIEKLNEEGRNPCNQAQKFVCIKANDANEFGNCECRDPSEPPVCPPGPER